MEKSNKKPILYKGELYGKSIKKGGGFSNKEMKVTFEEARETVLKDLQITKSVIREMPKNTRLPHEVVLSLVLRPEFTAKSYYPDSLFDSNYEKFGISEIGSRIYKDRSQDSISDGETDTPVSKMLFLRATEQSILAFENELNRSASVQKKAFITDIRKISSLGILSGEDQILGVSEQWQEGRLEAVVIGKYKYREFGK